MKTLLRSFLTTLRKVFYPTPRDQGIQTYTVHEIAEMMKPGPVDEQRLPIEFAHMLGEVLAEE